MEGYENAFVNNPLLQLNIANINHFDAVALKNN